MISQIVVIVTTVKLLFIPLYHSTDFEVHRNWLAITHNLTLDKWYYDNTSEWTLDYPPFFAWLEFVMSFVAKYFDPQMLYLTNLNYKSDMTILFQRLSVIVLDFVYIYSVKRFIDDRPHPLPVQRILVWNPFNNCLIAAFWFAVLLNLKHIFLYVAPVYIVYLFRAYCFTISSVDGVHTPWYSFSLTNLFKLAFTVIFVFGLSFGPFIYHIPQILSRLFPFKRGLCHAYWAPNFWAIYNFVDKVLQNIGTKLGLLRIPKAEASMTGGLVQQYDHAVLPSITPTMTIVLTVVTMIPALIKLWHLCADRRYRVLSFVRCMVVCAACSFLFGWHVHEKAILMILVPLTFLSVLGDVDGKQFLILTTVGNYSLFPLLYPKNLFSIKFFILLTHVALAFVNIRTLYEPAKVKGGRRIRVLRLPMLRQIESLYLYGLIVLCVYDNAIHGLWGLDKTLPFLPLMLTSVYCSIGVIYVWLCYYYYFLTFNVSQVPTLCTVNLAEKYKKTS
ncbi:hypothetical protein HF086_015073 [Spodoptera exigua]|uniref:Alpha-1,3-glucosyltransferase n=1 Tax=Spodoptera exigua TaxID=7107 RepID=A0A922MQH6_SPOEX|nr:hypothetical protein HF086_015073 [Spodoptera exigua]